MSDLFISPFTRHDNSNGAPMSGCKIFFYESGTLTPAPIYTTDELDTEHTNPVVSDAGGLFAPIYLDPAISYRAVLKTSANVTVQDIDPYSAADADTQNFLVHLSFIGTPDPQQVMDMVTFDREVSFEANLPDQAYANVSTAPGSDLVISLQLDGIEFGTCTIDSSGNATFDTDAAESTVGGFIRMVAPNDATTVVDVSMVIRGTTA